MVVCSSKMSVDFQHTTRTIHNHHCENLKSYKSPNGAVLEMFLRTKSFSTHEHCALNCRDIRTDTMDVSRWEENYINSNTKDKLELNVAHLDLLNKQG
jgi:hypothetical protein